MGYYILLFAAMFLFWFPAQQRGGESTLGFFLTAFGVGMGFMVVYFVVALILWLLFYRNPKKDDFPEVRFFNWYRRIFILGLLITAAIFYANESYSWSLGAAAMAFMIWIDDNLSLK